MKDSNEEHYTINMQTHYTVQYKDKTCTWVGDVGKIKYHNSITEAEAAIREVFSNGLNYVDEATIIEWKKTPVLVKKNIKPVIESNTTFDVEIYDRNESIWAWRVVEYGFETFKMAQDYIKAHTSRDTLYPAHRIIQRDVTVKTSVV
jgi:hypothetical protein